MEPKNIGDGGPAFPRALHVAATGEFAEAQEGMSLRDWFAGQALVAWIRCLDARRREPGYTDEGAAHEAARLSRISADAMIVERSA